jgi:chaperonin GroEL
MARKHILFRSATREKSCAGPHSLPIAVRVTLGPRSKSVLIEKTCGAPIVCNDRGNKAPDRSQRD